MARRLEDNMGAAAMRAATGHDHEQWREILDNAGAREWTHKATAQWLVDTHDVSPWWAQGITVDYEQARKGRLPGQRADGTFSVQKARTIPADRLEALAIVKTALSAVYGEPSGENLTAAQPVVRFKLEDGSRMSAAAGTPNASGTPVTVTQEKIVGAEAAASAKEKFSAILADL